MNARIINGDGSDQTGNDLTMRLECLLLCTGGGDRALKAAGLEPAIAD